MSSVHEISEKFKQSFCGICSDCKINQYYSVDTSFIDYNGTYYSLREILIEALDLHVNMKN